MEEYPKNNFMIKHLALILLTLIPVFAFAQSRENIADTQKFGVRLFLVPDAAAFEAMWTKPETPKLTAFNKVATNSEFAAVILYWGGGQGSDKNCNIQLSTTVLAGSEVKATGVSMPVCGGHEPPAPGVLALGDTTVDLVASGDPAKLTIKIEVTDLINNEKLVVSAPIEVVPQ